MFVLCKIEEQLIVVDAYDNPIKEFSHSLQYRRIVPFVISQMDNKIKRLVNENNPIQTYDQKGNLLIFIININDLHELLQD